MTEKLATLFDGITIDDARDNGRLNKQLAAVRAVALGTPGWFTLREMANMTGAPEASVSARLRDLRKPKFGGHNVERKYLERGLWAYRVTR